MLLLPKPKVRLSKLFLMLKTLLQMLKQLRIKRFLALKMLQVKRLKKLKMQFLMLKMLPKTQLKTLWVKQPMRLKKLPIN